MGYLEFLVRTTHYDNPAIPRLRDKIKLLRRTELAAYFFTGLAAFVIVLVAVCCLWLFSKPEWRDKAEAQLGPLIGVEIVVAIIAAILLRIARHCIAYRRMCEAERDRGEV